MSGCSTPRCWMRWPGSPANELRLTTDAAARPAQGAGLRRPNRRAAAHRRPQPGCHPAGRDPAPAVAGDARLVRRQRRTRITVCWRSGRCRRRWAPRPGICGRSATRARWPSGWPASSRPAGTRSRCSPGLRRPCRCSPTTTSCSLGHWPSSRRRCTPRPGGRAAAVAAVEAIRAIRRRELFRVAAGDCSGENDVVAGRRALTDLASATIDATLVVARAASDASRFLGSRSSRWAVGAVARCRTPPTRTPCS